MSNGFRLNEEFTYGGKTYIAVKEGERYSCRGCAISSGSPACDEANNLRSCEKTIFVEKNFGVGAIDTDAHRNAQDARNALMKAGLGDEHEALTFGPCAVHQATPEQTEAMLRRVGDTKATNPKDAIGIKKLPMHLVSGIVKAYAAVAHFLGNVKYGAWNYRAAGVRYSVYKAAAERHLDAWWEGEENDPADGTPHLANALACINILIEAKYTPSSIDDRPPSRKESLAKVRAELEAVMDRIVKQHGDKNPRHYTIGDKEFSE